MKLSFHFNTCTLLTLCCIHTLASRANALGLAMTGNHTPNHTAERITYPSSLFKGTIAKACNRMDSCKNAQYQGTMAPGTLSFHQRLCTEQSKAESCVSLESTKISRAMTIAWAIASNKHQRIMTTESDGGEPK
jgi:hypothetical protein